MALKVSWFTKAPEGTFDLRFDSVCILVLCFGSNLFVLNEICPFAFVEEVGVAQSVQRPSRSKSGATLTEADVKHAAA